MAQPCPKLAAKLTLPGYDGTEYEISAVVSIDEFAFSCRAKHLPLRLPSAEVFDTTAEPAPESKPALRMLNGGKR